MADEEKPAADAGGGENPQENAGTPAPEELKPQDESGGADVDKRPAIVTQAAKRRRASYKPSHKATFIGLAVVAVILGVNAAGLWFILRGQEDAAKTERESVILSADNLSKLGVSRNAVGTEGVELAINPDTEFGGKVTIAGDTTIGGQLSINGAFSAESGSFAELQGGDTAVDTLNVNGDATVSNLNLRENLTVNGNTDLQGRLTASQLVTINNNLNVSGNLSVGGAVTYDSLSIKSISLSGHIITTGANPTVSVGGAVGGAGTASGSGSDTAGTINVGVAAGASSGTLATLTFRNAYSGTPSVVVTPVGRAVPDMYITRSSTGFSIHTASALGFGGYAFDYFVID